MDFRRLEALRTVASLMSFSKAAKALHCTQSTVSAQIKTLEQELGATLFHRRGTAIALTKAGEAYLHYADKLLRIRNEAQTRVREAAEPECVLALRMPQSLSERYLPEILQAFQKEHPRVGLDVSVCAFAELQAELRAGVVDAAFLLAESVSTPDLDAQCLAVKELVFIAGPDHPAARLPRFGFADLAGRALLVPKHDCSYRMFLRRELLERDIRPDAVIECNSMGMLTACAARGLGVALVPEFVVSEELRRGALVRLAWDDGPLETGALMIRHKNAWMSDELRRFLEICREVIGRDASAPADLPGKPGASS